MPIASERLRVTIDRLSLGGEGVGRAGGMVVFVPYTVPGDEAEIELLERHPRFARARLLQLIRPSTDRLDPPCPYHFKITPPNDRKFCGGCSWQQIAYPAQLQAKRDLVRETLERLGGLRGIEVNPVLGMADPWRYRNKVQQPVGWDGTRLISGFFAPGSHDIMPIEECLVQPALSVAIINRTKALLERFKIRAYDSLHRHGWIRHLLVRTAGGEGALLTFVTRSQDFPHEREIVAALIEDFPQLLGIHQNVNPAATNVILGRQWRTVAGAAQIEQALGRLRFRLSPASFFQINTQQAEVLYDVAKRMAGRGPRLLDLYGGVGTIALWLADGFDEVGGVEEVPAAITDAEANAELNGISNVRFLAAPVEDFMREQAPDSGSGLTVTLDPPRAGCEASVLHSLGRIRPDRIVYVSCDPGTLARDLAVLVKAGYRVEEVQPVDLFPQTAHIETAVRLTREGAL
jgi:23S rRNA (uracil1939-C5)-methyltransferase